MKKTSVQPTEYQPYHQDEYAHGNGYLRAGREIVALDFSDLGIRNGCCGAGLIINDHKVIGGGFGYVALQPLAIAQLDFYTSRSTGPQLSA